MEICEREKTNRERRKARRENAKIWAVAIFTGGLTIAQQNARYWKWNLFEFRIGALFDELVMFSPMFSTSTKNKNKNSLGSGH